MLAGRTNSNEPYLHIPLLPRITRALEKGTDRRIDASEQAGRFFQQDRPVSFIKAKDAIALGVMLDPPQGDIRSNLVDMQRRWSEIEDRKI